MKRNENTITLFEGNSKYIADLYIVPANITGTFFKHKIRRNNNNLLLTGYRTRAGVPQYFIFKLNNKMKTRRVRSKVIQNTRRQYYRVIKFTVLVAWWRAARPRYRLHRMCVHALGFLESTDITMI